MSPDVGSNDKRDSISEKSKAGMFTLLIHPLQAILLSTIVEMNGLGNTR